MLKLEPPVTPLHTEWLRNIAVVKRGGRDARLRMLTRRVGQYCGAYMRAVPEVHGLRPQFATAAAATSAGDLLHCYTSVTDPLKELRSLIFRGQQGLARCPYCGLNEKDTLDHFLPKEIFPEFAVFPPNLVPVCSKCNLDKGQKYRSSGGVRSFIFPYFDDTLLAAGRWLKCAITMSGATPSIVFSLEHPPSLSGYLWLVVEEHYRELSLLERYSALASETFTDTLDSLSAVQRLPLSQRGSVIQAQLSEQARLMALRRGVNHYKVAILEGMATVSADLISLLS